MVETRWVQARWLQRLHCGIEFWAVEREAFGAFGSEVFNRTPMSSAQIIQLVSCRPGHDFIDVVQRHHAAMEHKLDIIGADGNAGCAIWWSGPNAFKAKLEAGTFQDRQRILQRRIASSELLDIVAPPTTASLVASGKTVADAAAMLVVTGKLTEGSPTDFAKVLAEDAAAGSAAARLPGVVAKFFLAGPDSERVGSCHLFESAEAMEAFIDNESFAAERAATPWAEESVTLERFVIMGHAVGAPATAPPTATGA